MRKIGLIILLAFALAASFATLSSEGANVLGPDVTVQPTGVKASINVSPTTITDLNTYHPGGSNYYPIVITGSGLQGNVNVYGTEHFQILYPITAPNSDCVELIPTNGNLQETVFVQLQGMLPNGEYSGDIRISSSTAEFTEQTVICSGTIFHAGSGITYFNFDGLNETKPEYAPGEVTLSGITWKLTEALISEAQGEYYSGSRGARLRGNPSAGNPPSTDEPCMEMLGYLPTGLGLLSFNYRRYGTDNQVPWIVEYRRSNDNDWTTAGSFSAPTNNNNWQYKSFQIEKSGNIRIRFRRDPDATLPLPNGECRINIDNIVVGDYYDFMPYGACGCINPLTDDRFSLETTVFPIDYSIISTPGPEPASYSEVYYHECFSLRPLVYDGPWGFFVHENLPGVEGGEGDALWAAVKYDGAWHESEMSAYSSGHPSSKSVAYFMVPSSAKNTGREVELLIGRKNPPTVPVTLSHFSATMTAENYVNLKWISQTETNLMGYNVLRSADDDLSTASQICAMIAATNSSEAHAYSYLDKDLVEDGTYYYWLQSVEMDGTTGFHGPASVIFSITGDGGTPSIPTVTQLEDAYPNPFNPNTTIRYQLESPGNVKIDIYNTKGQIVRSFSQSHDSAGYYNLLWDGCDSSGRALASGVYLYRMTSGNYSATKKMVLQK